MCQNIVEEFNKDTSILSNLFEAMIFAVQNKKMIHLVCCFKQQSLFCKSFSLPCIIFNEDNVWLNPILESPMMLKKWEFGKMS